MNPQAEKVRINRARHAARRRNLELRRSRVRDHSCPWYRLFCLLSADGRDVLALTREDGWHLRAHRGAVERWATWLSLSDVEHLLYGQGVAVVGADVVLQRPRELVGA